MTNQVLQIGRYKINSVNLYNINNPDKKINMIDLISEYTFRESILDSVMTGSIMVVDSVNLISNLPIRGEEILELIYEDYFENEITLEFFCYSIQELAPDELGQKQAYRIELISKEFIRSESLLVKRSLPSFRPAGPKGIPVSTMAQIIFDEYFDTEKEIEVEVSDGDLQLIIPALTPIDTMNFLKRKAKSAGSFASNYFFFENRERFYFVTSEYMINRVNREQIDETKVFKRVPNAAISGLDETSLAMYNLLDFQVVSKFDTVNNLRTGGMISDVIEVDILNRKYTHNVFNYNDEFVNFSHTDPTNEVRKPHTEDFIDKYFSTDNRKREFLVFVDEYRPNLNFDELISRRLSNYYFLDNMEVVIKIHGRNDIFAGDMIRLDIDDFVTAHKDKKPHETLSGYYLVKTIDHMLKDNNYISYLTVSKDHLRKVDQDE